MTGVLDTYVAIGQEAVAYNTTAATLTRGIEAKADVAKRTREHLRSTGLRAGLQATRSARSRVVDLGGEGTIEVDFANVGMSMLTRAMLGSFGITTPGGGTLSRLHTHLSTTTGPEGESLSVQIARGRIGGAVIPKTYTGGKVKKWTLSQAVGGADAQLKLKLEMDYAQERPASDVAAATASYPTDSWIFGWPDCIITVDGDQVDTLDFEASGDNTFKVDRRMLRGSAVKKEPVRTGVPVYSGMFNAEYLDDDLVDLANTGDIVPIVATWTGPEIETGKDFFVKLTMAACQFTGDTPQVQLGDVTKFAAPFDVLWDGTNPAVKLEVQTSDTSA